MILQKKRNSKKRREHIIIYDPQPGKIIHFVKLISLTFLQNYRLPYAILPEKTYQDL